MRQAPALPDRLAGTLGRLLGPDFPPALGLAVSGGGDSMAMLHLTAAWARPMGIALRVVTVDHGLRDGSAAEAALVADEARGLGLPHDTLRWEGWDGQGNLMDAARRARLDLIGRWRGDLSHVLFAHTQDDVAETFLMRLARGSGVEGLSALSEARPVPGPNGGWTLLRPLLDISRAELRHHLRVLRIPYAEDPTNTDEAYLRTRARAALAALKPLGLTATGLAATATRLSSDREVVRSRAAEVCDRIVLPPGDDPLHLGTLRLDRDAFARVERSTRLRLLSAALQLTASSDYRPRSDAVAGLLDRLDGGGAGTLHGCRAVPQGPTLHIFRELAAVRSLVTRAGDPWDTRWHFTGPAIQGLKVRALGWQGDLPPEAQVRTGLPPGALAALPALWNGETLAAFRPLGIGPDYDTRLLSPLAPRTGTLQEMLRDA